MTSRACCLPIMKPLPSSAHGKNHLAGTCYSCLLACLLLLLLWCPMVPGLAPPPWRPPGGKVLLIKALRVSQAWSLPLNTLKKMVEESCHGCYMFPRLTSDLPHIKHNPESCSDAARPRGLCSGLSLHTKHSKLPRKQARLLRPL